MADEEDEDLLDSWDAADSDELERRMELRDKEINKSENEELQQEKKSSNMNTMVGPVTILKADNVTRTEYTPQIKILKRNGNLDTKPALPKQNTESELKKTLKLKEAEYQAARNRILGEDYDETKSKLEEEEVKETKISIIKPPSRMSPTSPATPGSPIRLLTSADNRNLHDSRDACCVVRQPHGPNETTGFAINR